MLDHGRLDPTHFVRRDEPVYAPSRDFERDYRVSPRVSSSFFRFATRFLVLDDACGETGPETRGPGTAPC